ncbi:hypothetical protein L5G28_03830 [Gordonia sp. HY285]|uniref:Uncharacterized protein n=1 Tax=Gordonia liuliyuniae TaxID=2911517 RepID=A0ABS9ITE7_9ACTN|nr:hypothetical protein [Gordonia liuliyuniae]MCF8588829.1 hypothetical protein [Gordonia liuliyuniae]MCF8609293.1 hypothetical protein [Gordonia liuliyuniae]
MACVTSIGHEVILSEENVDGDDLITLEVDDMLIDMEHEQALRMWASLGAMLKDIPSRRCMTKCEVPQVISLPLPGLAG